LLFGLRSQKEKGLIYIKKISLLTCVRILTHTIFCICNIFVDLLWTFVGNSRYCLDMYANLHLWDRYFFFILRIVVVRIHYMLEKKNIWIVFLSFLQVLHNYCIICLPVLNTFSVFSRKLEMLYVFIYFCCNKKRHKCSSSWKISGCV